MSFWRFNTGSSHLLLIIPVLFLLSGCVSMGRRIEPEKLSLIKEGKTTKAEVLSLLGKPSMTMPISEYPGGQTLSYSWTRAVPAATDFVPVVGALSSKTTVYMQNIQIILDGNSVVRKVLVTEHEPTEVRTGILE